jgi:short-subunit dehydrogenase
MVPRGRGHVVNLASTAGRAGLPGGATYSASKWGVVGFSEAVRGELTGTGVHVTVVLPGIVNTALGEGVGAPLGIRRVEPDEVAAAVLAALRRPRFQVYVPWQAGPVAHLGATLPQSVREIVARVMGVDHALVGADTSARADYEAKVRQR